MPTPWVAILPTLLAAQTEAPSLPGVELKFLAREPGENGSYYLVIANRSRSDGLTGFTGAVLGGRIRGKARDGLESYLRSVKTNLENAR